MADVTPILISQLGSQTTLSDNDYFIVGGADAKKITVAQMKEAMGINALNMSISYKSIGNTSFENAVSNLNLNNPTIIWGQNLNGIDGITNNDNDVLIVAFRYPIQQYDSLKAIVFDFRSTKIKAISKVNGAWFGWYDIVN